MKMRNLNILISLLLALVPGIASEAQDTTPYARNFEVVRGTESLSIRSITQDSKHQIWFGTDKNLYSYDGYSPFVHIDRDGNNDHFQINAIECFDDKLLLGCVDGLVIYDCIKETFTTKEFLKGNEVFAFKRKGNEIWIGSEVGLFLYDISTDTFSPVNIKSDQPGTFNVRSIEFFEDKILAGTRSPGELCVFDPGRYPNFYNFSKDLFPLNFSSVDAIEVLDGSRLLLGTSSALYEFDTEKLVARLIARLSWVKTICKDGDRFLVGTDNGLYAYDTASGSIEKIVNNVVWKIIRDVEQNIWFGSDTGLLISKRNKLINSTYVTPSGANNLYSSICGDGSGNIFAGGSYGIIMFDGKDLSLPSRWYKMSDPVYPLIHNKVRQIKQNSFTGDIWAETASGLIRFDNTTQQFISTRADITLSNAFDFHFEKDRFWVAGLSGLFCVKDGVAIESFTTKDGLSSNRIAQVVKDCIGRLWIRTIDRNVYIINPQTESVTRFYLRQIATGSLWDYIYSDSSANIWLSSGNEICKVEPRISDAIVADYHLSAQTSVDTNCLLEVENHLWVCSAAGIFIIDKRTGAISHVYTDENYVSLYYDRATGTIYLGALDKISVIKYADFMETTSRSTPRIYITKITANDTDIPVEDYADGVLTLPHNKNNISISFSGFHYSRENSQRFRFNLNGTSSSWFETTKSSNSILLTDLAPKAYKLYVTTINYASADQPLLSIRIKRPWYTSIVAIIIYILLLAYISILFVKMYLYRKRIKIEQIQRSKEMAQAKSKINFFADIAHEFKTPLSLIVAPASKLLHESTDIKDRQSLQLIHDNAMKLNSLIHMSLDYYNDKKDIAKTVITSNVEFVSFARQIFTSFQENFANLDFSFITNNDNIPITIDVVKMETILTNIISNACKYTPAGGSIILSIAYNKEGGILAIKVSDTGIGIPKEELPYIFQRYYQSSRTKSNVASTGLGLAIVKSYVDILNGVITADSDSHGTSFLIKFPVNNAETTGDAVSENVEVKNPEQKPLVVIVDDNKPICDFLVNILRDKYHCLCAHSGAKGLKLCQDVMPDLIISDVVMPDMNGLQMCRKIRQTPSLSIIPIILLTAKDDKDTEKESIELNIDAVIGKPFDMESLLARVSQLILKSRQVEKKVKIDMISKPTEVHTVSPDEKFLIDVTKLIESHIDEPELSVTNLCELGNYTEKNLYRKIKKLTGQSTVEYIRSIRLKKAALLLQNGNFTVSETMYMVGFSNTSYFSKAFCSQFGKTPKEYQQSFKEQQG